MQKPFSRLSSLALVVLCLPLPSLFSASPADNEGRSAAVGQRTPARTFTSDSVCPLEGTTESYHAFLTCATYATPAQNYTVYLYSSDGPQQVSGATIQEGAVYDRANMFIGTLNPANSQIYDLNDNSIGFVSLSSPPGA